MIFCYCSLSGLRQPREMWFWRKVGAVKKYPNLFLLLVLRIGQTSQKSESRRLDDVLPGVSLWWVEQEEGRGGTEVAQIENSRPWYWPQRAQKKTKAEVDLRAAWTVNTLPALLQIHRQKTKPSWIKVVNYWMTTKLCRQRDNPQESRLKIRTRIKDKNWQPHTIEWDLTDSA